ncbi:MAG TPA: prepilin-type N-terminal cleavage/methylation domain-containing protein [Bryobacteraceae bacterium]|nr:prepilin-type N-terminal cleavage/methylation domain-containing protein [Bryobacteraceae bacterium]
MRHGARAGVTLIEVLVAVTLLSLLTLGMFLAMRVGLAAYTKANTKLMDDRRVAGAQRVLVQELEGLVPAYAACGAGPGSPGARAAFFQGDAATMRLVSTFSLQQGWRGQAQILELLVIPGENGLGVRLVVNELPYGGPMTTGQLCTSVTIDPSGTGTVAHYLPVAAGPHSFVLADKLEFCRFSYYAPGPQLYSPPVWTAEWTRKGWPLGVRVEMAPLSPDASRLQPISVTAPIHIRRNPDIKYVDQY